MITEIEANTQLGYENLVKRVHECFKKGTKGKHLFGDASRREEYCLARREIATYEQKLIDAQHTVRPISPTQLESYLILIDNLRSQIREQHGYAMEAQT